jgi:hypothetical protein
MGNLRKAIENSVLDDFIKEFYELRGESVDQA